MLTERPQEKFDGISLAFAACPESISPSCLGSDEEMADEE
jgi:hypothetical protein